jgi:tetratricopeptide (TPR) repeat protein
LVDLFTQIRSGEVSPSVLFVHAHIAAAQGETERALELMQKVVDHPDANYEDLHNVSSLAAMMSIGRLSVEVARLNYERFPDDPRAKKEFMARLCVSDISEYWPEGEKLAREIRKADPNDLGVVLALSDVMRKQKKFEETYKMLREVQDSLKEPSAQILRNLGRSAEDVNDLAAAEAYYEKAVDTDPEDSQAAGWFATFLEKQRRVEEADRMFQEATRRDPKDAKHLARYAIFLAEVRKDDQKAQEYFEKACQAEPTNPIIRFGYIQWLLERGMREEAARLMGGSEGSRRFMQPPGGE